MAIPPIQGRALPPTASPKPASDPRAAAQRAFFETALVKAGGTAAPTAAPTPSVAASRAIQPAVTRLKDEAAIPPHPGRVLRPGSLVDIKV